MNTPLVSIIIPCYNAAQFLEETLQSVLDMNYSAWECIIVNDGSTDNSQSVIATYVQQDSRFRCIEQSNAGPSKARNTGIQSSNGIYILPLDSDDLISKKYVSEAVTILENSPSTLNNAKGALYLLHNCLKNWVNHCSLQLQEIFKSGTGTWPLNVAIVHNHIFARLIVTDES